MRPFLLSALLLALGSITVSAQNPWQWQVPMPLEDSSFPSDIAFTGTGHGYIVCYDGMIYQSLDSGLTWQVLSRQTDSALRAITFNGDNGLVVGAGTILRTGNGGASWEHCGNVPLDVVLLSVDMTETGHAMAAGVGGVIMRTSNGGRKWTMVHRDSIVDPNPYEPNPLYDIEMIDSLHAVAVGFEGIMRTSDGGSTWMITKMPYQLLPRTVEFTSALNGAIGGYDFTSFFGSPSLLLYTVDGGVTWDTGTHTWKWSGSEYGDHATDMHFIDSMHAIACGTSFLETHDGGVTWYEMYGAIWTEQFDILGDSVIVAIGIDGKIYRGTRSIIAALPRTPRHDLKSTLRFEQNTPNPFSHSTTLRFVLPSSAPTRITVEDALGRRMATLVDRMMESGEHEVSWDATNAPAGIYFCVLRQNASVTTRRMVKR